MTCPNGHVKVSCFCELYKTGSICKSCFSTSAYNCCIPCLETHLDCINSFTKVKNGREIREVTLSFATECVIYESNGTIEELFEVIKYIVLLGCKPHSESMSFKYTPKQLLWLMRRGLGMYKSYIYDYVTLRKWMHIEIIKTAMEEQNDKYIADLCDIMLHLRNLVRVDCVIPLVLDYLDHNDLINDELS